MDRQVRVVENLVERRRCHTETKVHFLVFVEQPFLYCIASGIADIARYLAVFKLTDDLRDLAYSSLEVRHAKPPTAARPAVPP